MSSWSSNLRFPSRGLRARGAKVQSSTPPQPVVPARASSSPRQIPTNGQTLVSGQVGTEVLFRDAALIGGEGFCANRSLGLVPDPSLTNSCPIVIARCAT